MKMSNFSFIKFSQKLGPSDLGNLVEPLRELILLSKVLWGVPNMCLDLKSEVGKAVSIEDGQTDNRISILDPTPMCNAQLFNLGF